ncbi:MAG: hypothetical protein BWZ03_00539 [bacterium ADurb.BinA186]|nr:MAG: hypothetical protein BWZ03_00539 [bacterium ADurb.BinA186]
MALCKKRAFEIEGFVMTGKAWRKNEAHPVLCLPGLIDNSASFDFIAPLLDDFYLIALDSFGVGFSSNNLPLLPTLKSAI